jgi:hypothetical protein
MSAKIAHGILVAVWGTSSKAFSGLAIKADRGAAWFDGTLGTRRKPTRRPCAKIGCVEGPNMAIDANIRTEAIAREPSSDG